MRGRLVRRTWRHDPTLYAPARFRRACAYDAFVPDPLLGAQLQLDGDLAGVVSDAESAIARLNRQAAPTLAPLARLLLRTESIASSKVEGLQVDARQLALAEAASDVGRRSSATALEILANVDAMALAVEEAATTEQFSPADIVAIHHELMRHAPNARIAGQVRDQQNWIGGNDYNPCGAAFVPPPETEVDALLDDLCLAMGDDGLPPIVQAALVHAQFETIHPFLDGNGRAGRALIQVVLRRRGLAPSYVPPISVVLAADRDRYIEGLAGFRADRVGEWIERFAVAAARSANLAHAYLGTVDDLQAQWRIQLDARVGPRRDAAAWALIDVLPAHPILTVAVGVAATGRSKPAVNQGVAQLVEARVLRPVSEGSRNRRWEARGLIDVVAGLEAGNDPEPASVPASGR
jgi:Fic family protein